YFEHFPVEVYIFPRAQQENIASAKGWLFPFDHSQLKIVIFIAVKLVLYFLGLPVIPFFPFQACEVFIIRV
ncbi:MAG: hypothetical protein FWD39_04570, partial [Clostridiales bacterium]|nr:hypothetical protein [Clostridiales bacterium]